MALIALQDIYKTYEIGEISIPVLRGISLNIQKGDFVALMGASGSGKTTLMNILGCLDHPTSGSYWFDGQDVVGLSADERAILRNQKIGFVFQNFNLLPRTSALENVMMPLSYTMEHTSDREAHKRAEELLQRVGLGEHLDHEPSQLSGGQQQRVAIARALINHPPLLFADEPTGNLDSQTSEEVLRIFEQLNEEEGVTIILVTHDPNIAQHAKRIIRIKDGIIEPERVGHPGAVAEPGEAPAAERPERRKAQLGRLPCAVPPDGAHGPEQSSPERSAGCTHDSRDRHRRGRGNCHDGDRARIVELHPALHRQHGGKQHGDSARVPHPAAG